MMSCKNIRSERSNKALICRSTRPPNYHLPALILPCWSACSTISLINAFVHTPAGGHIKVSLASLGDTLKIAISDSGKGIPANDLPHVFEPFFQGESGSANPNHAGLGLAIAKRIMELLHGDITVASKQGQGTRFTLAVPVTLS